MIIIASHKDGAKWYGPVAQSGRAPPLQGGGLGFKSRRVHFNAVSNFNYLRRAEKITHVIFNDG